MVIAFARTLDWHGYANLAALLTVAEESHLHKRVGVTNLFDEINAVGYYELDLSIPDHRFVAQEPPPPSLPY